MRRRGLRSALAGVAAILLSMALFGCSSGDDGAGNGDCSNGSPCTLDSDCPGGMRCNEEECTKLFCVARGVACDTSEVCESRSCVYGPNGGVCWDGPRPLGWPCTYPLDCMDGLACEDGECATPPPPPTPHATLEVTPRSLRFSMLEGATNPAPEDLEIENSGNESLTFDISSDVPWISVDLASAVLAPSSGTLVSVSVDGTGLPPDMHSGTVTVDAMGAYNAPAYVTVDFSVTVAPRCTGTPTPCSQRTAPCTAGCVSGPGCAGGDIVCPASSSGAGCPFCNSITGCECDAAMSACSPAPMEGPTACESQTNQTTCIQFTNCTWRATGGCAGTPTPCETLGTVRTLDDTPWCETQPGCAVTTGP